MIEILNAPDHVAAYRISGTLTVEDYDRMIEDVEARLALQKRIAIFADMTGFDDVTVRAGLKDMRYSLSKLGELRRFPRNAVVTDKGWMTFLVKAMSPLVPFVEIRVFTPEERAAALEWVSAPLD